MAYKDEYEVGRLYSNGDFLAKIAQQFSGDYELRFHLAPPVLGKRDPQTQQPIKQEFGPWMLKAFALLSKLRFLRGTALDPFGSTMERKQERADIKDYQDLIVLFTDSLSEENYEIAKELADLPAKLRGFGHVKDDSRKRLLLQKETLLTRFRGESAVAAVKIVDAA